MRKPFFKKSHRAWYAEIGGKQVRLGADEKEAFEEFGRLVAGHQPATSKTTVAEIVYQFLVWTDEHRADESYRWYKRHCTSFVSYAGSRLKVSELKPLHITRWLDSSYKDSGDTNKNGAVRAVSRALNWAVKQGVLAANPISRMERPAAQTREIYIDDDQWSRVVAAVKVSVERDALNFLDSTGARPQELRLIEASHWDRANRRIVLERERSKGKKVRRVIRLNDAATEIVTRLVLKNPAGPIFRNRKGEPLTRSALAQRFRKLRNKLEIAGLCCYAVRHRFCTRALLAGVDPMSVAALMGHKDATMVMRIYGHLAQQDEFLAAKLAQATGERSA